MWNLPLKLIRYLLLLEVNGAMALLPQRPEVEFSLYLAQIIAGQLPTSQARPWVKSRAKWMEAYKKNTFSRNPAAPDSPWPIQALILRYPVRDTYLRGQTLLWELRLFGEDADHAFFMEVLLPALETLGSQSPDRGRESAQLWGNFDIRSIYTARGSTWKPLFLNGRLDLRRKVAPFQWDRDLKPGFRSYAQLKRIIWWTPFHLLLGHKFSPSAKESIAPSINAILVATLQRAARILYGQHGSVDDLFAHLDPDALEMVKIAGQKAADLKIQHHDIQSAKPFHTPLWEGSQTFFDPIPMELLSILQISAIFHVGRFTHFGFGGLRAEL